MYVPDRFDVLPKSSFRSESFAFRGWTLSDSEILLQRNAILAKA